jgi:hypothetical protein
VWLERMEQKGMIAASPGTGPAQPDGQRAAAAW